MLNTSNVGIFAARSDGTITLELATDNPAFEDMATKFFEHFVAITDAMNTLGGSGLWDEQDGFYYDVIALDGGGWTVVTLEPVTVHRPGDGTDDEMSFWFVTAERRPVDSCR